MDRKEFERFAGIPEGWLDEFSYTACASAIGNAVVPQVVEIIGRAIMEVERQ